MVPGDHSALPNNASYFYLAEGAANIVYTICAPESTPLGVVEEWEVNALQQSDTDSESRPRLKSFESKQSI